MKKFSLSVIIPLQNEEANLPTLFRALEKQIYTDFEVLFVNNNGCNASAAMVEAWQKKQKNKAVFLLENKKNSTATSILAAIKKVKSDIIICLGDNCIPSPHWAKEMHQALAKKMIVVGDTEVLVAPGASAPEKIGKALFHNYSYRCANAIGYALPWGPIQNFGFQKKLLQSVGLFNELAGNAFDMDWCWRAVLQGHLPFHVAEAKVLYQTIKKEEAFLAQIAQFGAGEAWIRSHYSFLLAKEEQLEFLQQTQLQQALAGAERLLSTLPQNKFSQKVATAFACGIVDGTKDTPKKIRKNKNLSWGFPIGESEKEIRILVPGKGVLHLDNDGISLWKLFQKNKTKKSLAKAMQHNFSMHVHEALHEAEHFIEALRVNSSKETHEH